MTLGIRVLVGMLGLLTVLSGCAGYRVGNISGRELQGVRSVFVPTVKNETIEPGLPVMVSNEIIRRFDNDGTLETLQSAQADSELDVTIKRMERRPVRGNRRNTLLTETYELTLVAEATFINRKLGRKVFESKEVRGRTEYFVQNNMQEVERQALPLAAEDLANQVVSMVTEGW
jgi:hypothetical protein